MFFKRKAYDQLLNWKNRYAGKYSILLEGARRVGKSTIAEEFARNEYRSYILIDFLLSDHAKTTAIEVKSSGLGKHSSLDSFREKYSDSVKDTIILSQKDVKKEQNIRYYPIYMLPFLLEKMGISGEEKYV